MALTPFRQTPRQLRAAICALGLAVAATASCSAPPAESYRYEGIAVAADTIVWLGEREGTAYVGTYLVAGGRYMGQGGRWAVRQVSSHAFRSTDPPDQALRDWLNGELAQLERTPASAELDSGRQNLEAETQPGRQPH